MQSIWPIVLQHLLPILGFLLALVLVVHLVREPRPPASTVAWLLAIFLVPYVGVPLYIMVGGRKLRRMMRAKQALPLSAGPAALRREAELARGGVTFPPRPGHKVELLLTGEDAFRAVSDMVESASHSVDVATYVLGRDETGRAVLDLLTQKAAQGVQVRLLLDAVGCRKVSGRMLEPLRRAGGRCAFFMPMLHVPFRGRANLRNHRKMILADGRAAIIGGMNLAGEYMGPEGIPKRWCDLSLVLEGPVVGDLNEVFASDWAFAAGEEGSEARAAAPAETPGPAPVQLVPSGPDVPGDFLYDTILTRFFGAAGRIWVVTPYFVPDDALTRALCIAARRGVDVRIVVPAVSNHRFADMARRGYLRQVQTAGGAVYRFIPGMLHGKVILIDDSVSVVGSMNMDLRSLFLNYEVACFVESADVARRLGEWAEGVMARSEVGMRPAAAPVEFIEGIGRLFAPLL